MQKISGERRLESENNYVSEGQALFRCNRCNGTFQEPIVATLSSRDRVQTYHACPRCLSKIIQVEPQKTEKTEQASISMKNVKKTVAKSEENVKCKHFLGYLKKRPKDAAFPDECLVCGKMIECLTR